jgi:hypothetical protein
LWAVLSRSEVAPRRPGLAGWGARIRTWERWNQALTGFSPLAAERAGILLRTERQCHRPGVTASPGSWRHGHLPMIFPRLLSGKMTCRQSTPSLAIDFNGAPDRIRVTPAFGGQQAIGRRSSFEGDAHAATGDLHSATLRFAAVTTPHPYYDVKPLHAK